MNLSTSKRCSKAIKAILGVGLIAAFIVAGSVDGWAQTFDLERMPTISEVPFAFVGTWDWRTPRQSCGTRLDSYGNPRTLPGAPGELLCQWPADRLEAMLNGRGRAWLEFSQGDDALSPKWACAKASLGTVLTEGYLRTFSKRPDALVMHFEQSNWWRWVWMDGRPHPPATESFSHGHSIGWMDGNTLVVETTNLTWDPDGYDDLSHIARSHLAKFTERYTLIANDRMELEITVEDPLFLKGPFVFTGTLERTDEAPINTWDCDPEAGLKELYSTFNNPYPDDTTPAKYND